MTALSRTTSTPGEPLAITRARWQEELFSISPRRMDLASLSAEWPLRRIRLQVYRNAPFEFVAAPMKPFLAFAGITADIALSAYDDSLLFADLDGVDEPDLHLVWLDYNRFRGQMAPASFASWLAGRLEILRQQSHAPVLIADCPGNDDFHVAVRSHLKEVSELISGCRIFPLSEVANELGDNFIDQRMVGVAASPLSAKATIAIARELGLRWIPAAMGQMIKAVALDLDNTLYSGVLGEDGPEGLILTEEHKALQQHIVSLHKAGFFIALVSKNEAEDVKKLFETRDDFPLRPEHISASAISWHSKVEGLSDIAAALRIGFDAILFVDDNPGELVSVTTGYPQIHSIFARDPAASLRAIERHPGMFHWHEDRTASIRAKDLESNKARAAIQEGTNSATDYLKTLETKLVFSVNDKSSITRMHALSTKTNQFNLALNRFSEAEVARRMDDPDSWLVAISLSDKLSDSGIIGAIYMSREQKDQLVVDELCVSCRALGRGLEDLMIGSAVDKVAQIAGGIKQVAVKHATGPRNQPARQWLERFTGVTPDGDTGKLLIDWPPHDLNERFSSLDLDLQWIGA